MGLSRLAAKCQKCRYKDSCNNKEMEALAYMQLTAASMSAPVAIQPIQPMARGVITVNMGTAAGKFYRDEVEEQIKKALHRQICKGLDKEG